jgi:phosphoserine phosphatase
VVSHDDVAGRIQREIVPVLEFARERRIRSVLISASPRTVVEAAGALLGFGPHDIAAATPKVVGGLVVAEMDGPVPYAEDKLTSGRQLFGQTRWLAAFGDNVFDIDMLTTAELGVAVRPKPRLREKLGGLHIKVLAAPDHANERATHR